MAAKKAEPRRRQRRAPSAKLREALNKAKRQGWFKWIRQGPGQEADEKAILNGCYFSQHRADHFLDFADKYGTLTEGAFKDQPFRLMDWQAESASRVFGWIKNSDEWGYPVRRFRYWYLEVPKKSGKTPFISLIGNYLFFADSAGRQINIYTAATTRKQAERLLKHSIRQRSNRPALAAASEVKKLEGFQSMHFGDNEWHVVAADPDSADGVNGHCLADEIHRWKGHEFYNTLRYMLASQPEGLFAAITTAGNDMESVCRTLHDKTKAVDAGRQLDEQFFGQIFAADPDDDPHDEKTWLKANPSLGTKPSSPLKMSSFRADYETAKADPSQWAIWCQLRLNLWRTNQSSWLESALPRGFADWDSGKLGRGKKKRRVDCFEPFDESDLKGKHCRLGFDSASVKDTTAAVLSFASEDEPEVVRVLARFWLPERAAEQQAKRVAYKQWIEDGWIKVTPGDAVDFRTICNDLIGWLQHFNCSRLYFDPLFQAEWLTQEIEAAAGLERIRFQQNFTNFSPVMKETERLLIGHKVRHNGNPVLSWHIGNTQARENANNEKRPVKPPDGDHRKIDGSVAMLMSLADIVTGDDDADYYDDHDVETL